MKKLIALIASFIFTANSFSQIEKDIAESVNSLERDSSFVDNLYLQGEFMSLIKNESHSELLEAYNAEGFKLFTKMTYIDGQRQRTITVSDDSTFLSILDEILRDLPSDFNVSPTFTEADSLLDDQVTDSWIYANRVGNKCKVKVYFINNQLKSLGYWIYR